MEVNEGKSVDPRSDSFEYVDISEFVVVEKKEKGNKGISSEGEKLPCKGTYPRCTADKRKDTISSPVKQSGAENTSKESNGTSKGLTSPRFQRSSEDKTAKLDERMEDSDDGIEVLYEESAIRYKGPSFVSGTVTKVIPHKRPDLASSMITRKTSAVKQSSAENTLKPSKGTSKDYTTEGMCPCCNCDIGDTSCSKCIELNYKCPGSCYCCSPHRRNEAEKRMKKELAEAMEDIS